ncbi:TPA: MBL fold metallo-hydrolase [Candidatus Scatousia excrementigallinarum]|uniref:MBL fold metallo-hydrolase n=1 Tax=Candidatus Scatousia excrementigallinarum TaxID=2840935 RepID=A0A9D1EXI6_9BACT|nr:MBL fold metallo-hydrolase [Candidatus Scatousia excrementigallinarum]
MSEFKVKFRGVRGSYPLAKKEFLKYGGNTSCVEVHAGGHLIVLDAGTGLIDVGNELLRDYIASGVKPEERTPVKAVVLLSHIHLDHIQGFTFFRPLHIPSTVLNVYGNVNYNETLSDELAGLLFGKSFPLDLGDIAGNLNIKDINETEGIILRHGEPPIIRRIEKDEDLIVGDDDVLITCYRSYAHPQEGVFVYKITYKGKTLVYATDKESYLGGDKKLVNFARGCNLLIHDAQYTTEDYLNSYVPKQGYGHSTFDMAVECQNQTGAEKLVFFHFDPEYDDEKLDSIQEQYKAISDRAMLAYEGLEINLL